VIKLSFLNGENYHSPRLKFKVLTKFLSASNQIVKDLDCPPLPPEGHKNDQPASKLARFGSLFLKNQKERNEPLQLHFAEPQKFRS
jgi:hypothetical protein